MLLLLCVWVPSSRKCVCECVLFSSLMGVDFCTRKNPSSCAVFAKHHLQKKKKNLCEEEITTVKAREVKPTVSTLLFFFAVVVEKRREIW